MAIFFVISGYVLSAGPLKALHAEDEAGLLRRVGSAVFRRWFRLFIPVASTTLIWATTWHLFGLQNLNPVASAPERTFFDELWRWYCDFKNFSFAFTGDPVNAYNDHTWSIPMEFRGSILIYTACVAFTQVGTTKRLVCEGVLAWYFMWIVDGWYCCLFMIGMIFCDLDLLAKRNATPAFFVYFGHMKPWMAYTLFGMSMYLGGVPSISNDLPHLRKSPGWYFLSFLKPQAVYDFRWFYRTIAAALAMTSIPRIPKIKGFFEMQFCQYLGRISFGFYLVHGPVLWSLGDRIYAASGRVREGHINVVPEWINYSPFSGWGPFGLEINYLASHIILLPVTLWLADVVTRVFDEPSVKISKWLFDTAIRP